MKKIKVTLLMLLMSFLFIGCTGNQTKYKDLSACNVELVIDDTSSLETELHKIYKITIPAKTSIALRSLFIIGTDLSSEVEPVFSENEFVLTGSKITTQLISITGNDEITKKVVLVEGEKNYETTEEESIKYNEFIERYKTKDKEIQNSGKINEGDIFVKTNENAEYINYPYLGTSAGVNFYLTNDTDLPQEVYYNIFVKDTSLEVAKNIFFYLLEGFREPDKIKVNKEKNTDYGEIFKVASTFLKEDKTEYKIKEMERYYAEKYIKNKVKEVLISQFGELSNGQDKILNYLVTTFTDIYFNKDSSFFINESSI